MEVFNPKPRPIGPNLIGLGVASLFIAILSSFPKTDFLGNLEVYTSHKYLRFIIPCLFVLWTIQMGVGNLEQTTTNVIFQKIIITAVAVIGMLLIRQLPPFGTEQKIALGLLFLIFLCELGIPTESRSTITSLLTVAFLGVLIYGNIPIARQVYAERQSLMELVKYYLWDY